MVGRILDHGVINTGKLLDPEGNRDLRIHKLGKTVCDLSVFHPDSTDLNDLIFHSRKSRGLNIKDYIGPVKRLSLAVVHNPFQGRSTR